MPCSRPLRRAHALLRAPALLLLTLPGAWPAATGATATRLSELPAAWVDDGGQPFDQSAYINVVPHTFIPARLSH
ncbi:MAG: hypothetical protein E6K36_17625 [Gammaproteobacteria bacterium]|nr:MAG: hypothetical protein E6K36_17625 [Gammaproteobacteria bacterium]